MRFQNKIAIVTGAASGIGQATALRLESEGATVVRLDITQIDHPNALICDVSDETAVQGCVEQVLKVHGHIDVLCNNAGVLCTVASIQDIDSSDWERVMGVNLFGAAHFIKHAASAMIEQRGGAIVNTASVAGLRSGAGGTVYSASKAGLINLTQTAACDLGRYNIRVNAVCPGLVETGMTETIFNHARSVGKAHKLGSRAELARYGTPNDIAAAIAFLASDEAGFITGQTLAVDGGNSASLNMPGMKI